MLAEEEVERALEQYGDNVRRICFIYLKKEADVEDVFQNVFFKYAQKTTSFSSLEHEKAWILRVTINECNSLLRRWFHRKVDLVEDISVYGMEEEAKYPEVLQAVLSLPPKLKNVIYLYYYEGYKIKEIAEILKRKENTIHTWMRRGKAILKEMLGDDTFENTNE
jgi:RNA polymerase sigma-70 factor (ECF subfamily)